MNDFQLHYLHQARSRELIAAAEHARRAGEAKRADGRGEGLLARLARALHREKGGVATKAHRFQLAK